MEKLGLGMVVALFVLTISMPAHGATMQCLSNEETVYGGFCQQKYKFITVVITVEPGDCLSVIAQEMNKKGYYGCSRVLWPELFKQNNDVVGANPHLIHPGMILTYKTCMPAGRGVLCVI